MDPHSTQRGYTVTAALVLCIFAALCVSNIFDYSPTYDEPKYLLIGENLVSPQDVRTHADASQDMQLFDRVGDVVHPPLSFYTHGLLLKPFHFATENVRLRWARIIMLGYGVALGALVFVWASKLFDARGGLVALTLYGFNSNILAHSSIITTDVILACFSLFLLYFFWRYVEDRRKRWIVASGISLGLAMLSKHSAVLWCLTLPAVAVALWLREPAREDVGEDDPHRLGSLVRFLVAVAVILALGVFVLDIGYGCKGIFVPLGANYYQSRLLTALSTHPLTSWIPAPIPYAFLRGFDSQKYIVEVGHPSFLAGMRSTTGWPYYFPICVLLKMPVAFWFVFGWTVVVLFRSRKRSQRRAEIILMVPVLALLGVNIFLSRNQLGIRFVLTAIPPIFILCGAVATDLSKRWKKAALALLVCLYVLSALRIHPHHIAYFSELVGGPKNGYKWLSDSNLDWGQDLDRAREYVRASNVPIRVNPGMLPVSGRILINATTLQDCFAPYEIHNWLLPFKPVDYIGYSWLIYDITDETVSSRPHKSGELPDEYYLAAFEYSRDHLPSAERLAEATLGRGTRLPEAFYLLGLARLGQDELDGAAEAFEAISESHPLYAEARANLSFISALRADVPAMEAFWKQSMIGETLRAYAHTPKLDSEHYVTLVAAEPGSWKQLNNLGVSRWAEGRLAEAERDLRAAWELQPNFAEPLANLAIVLEEERHFAESLRVMRKYNDESLLARTAPYRDYRVYYQNTRIMMGDTLEVFPRPDEEVLWLKEYVIRYPEDISALNRLADILARGGRLGEAHECLSRALVFAPSDGGTLMNLAVLYTEKKMYSRALRACEAAVSATPDNTSAADLLRFLRQKASVSQ